jgi:predicted RNA-binding Zn-ribbon protein involved in translation (DUF1610 family)
MADDNKGVRFECRHCGRTLPTDEPKRPCPNCGKIGRKITANQKDMISIREEQPTAVLERVYRRYPALLISIAITVIVPIITLLLHLNEQIAFYVGEVSGVTAFIIALDTTVKVKRIIGGGGEGF